MCFFFFKQKTAYEMRISDWSSDVCSSDLLHETHHDRSGGAGPLAMLGGFGVLLRDAGFVGYAVNVSFTTAVFFAFLAGAPYVMIELMDRPSSEYGLYFMLNAVSYMAGNYASGRLATRIGPDRMILYRKSTRLHSRH